MQRVQIYQSVYFFPVTYTSVKGTLESNENENKR